MLSFNNLTLSFTLVFCLLWPSPSSFTEARCGYPELPHSAQLVSSHFEETGYFAEGQKVKVICENGLIAHERPPSPTLGLEAELKSNYSDVESSPENYMVVDSVDLIVCQNSHWNSSGLRCLHRVSLDARNVQVKWKEVEAVRSLDALVDRNAHSCIDIDLDSKHLDKEQKESVLFSVRLEGGSGAGRVPRTVLMVKSGPQMTDGHSNMTLLEDLIMDMNTVANLSDSDGDVEVEEAKRFLDFVYETEFNALNYTGPVKMMLLGEDEVSDRKHKVIRIGNHEVRLSVSLGSTENPKQSLECFFNEDAAITVDRNVSTELLIFDCQSPEEKDKTNIIWVRLDISKLNDSTVNSTSVNTTEKTSSLFQLCGLEAFGTVESVSCGKPYVPIYGIVTKTKDTSGGADSITTAEYGCMTGYRAINLTLEEQSALMNTPTSAKKINGKDSGENNLMSMTRRCNPITKKWIPEVEDIYCEPSVSCRHPPPIGDARKFYFEYGKLDNLKRAIGGRSTATLRCLQVTDFVVPFTFYSCDTSGQWVKMTQKNSTNADLPACRSMLLGRSSRRGRPSHFHHHYYHYYQNETPHNRTSIIIFGRQINDNKYIIYYGAAGLVLLFGGSFIILFHVRRMAKKISRQMRERSYMAAEKGVADHFLPVSGNGMEDGNLPPYYNQSGNDSFYDGSGGTMFSNDLPPPATPISMPTSGLEKGDYKDKNNLSSNFDSIKF